MASKSVGQVTRGHIHLWLASLMDSVRVTLTRWQSLYGPTGCRESSRLMSIDLLLVALSFHINHHHWFFLIKFTAGVNFLCFNYRSFQSACGDFHSFIYSHATSSNQVVYFLSWLFYWKSLIFRKSQKCNPKLKIFEGSSKIFKNY